MGRRYGVKENIWTEEKKSSEDEENYILRRYNYGYDGTCSI
jgi:hypothetical protein